jgi:uncharacterized protein YejL (UPF0352 family)
MNAFHLRLESATDTEWGVVETFKHSLSAALSAMVNVAMKHNCPVRLVCVNSGKVVAGINLEHLHVAEVTKINTKV